MMAKNNDPHAGEPEPIDEVIPPTDEVNPEVRPSELDETYKEKECDAAADEQVALAEARGEEEARPTDEQAARTRRRAKSAKKVLRGAEKAVKEVERRYWTASARLDVFVDRPAQAKRIYWIRLAGLLVGDVAACSGAILLLGETQANAVGQALSAAVAAVTLGAIGSDTKRHRQARMHAIELQNEERDPSFDPLFRGRTDGDRLMRNVTLLAFAGLAFIAIGIFALRSLTEGSAAAWTFGLLSAAIGVASYVNSYTTTCAFGEHLDRLKAEVASARAWLQSCQSDPVIAEHDAAVVASASTRAIWRARGLAAWWARQREKFAILNNNPRIVGNGFAAPEEVAGPAGITQHSAADEDAA